MTNQFLAERSDPNIPCCGYHIKVVFDKPIKYKGWRSEAKYFKESHYFGSCRADRLEERIQEQLNPEIVYEDHAVTVRNLPDGVPYPYKQSNWIFDGIHKYGGKPELVETIELPTTDLSKAAEIWDKGMSEYYEKKLGLLAYGK